MNDPCTLTILLFGSLADAVGARRLELSLPMPARASDALDALASEHGPIRAARPSLALAINHAYAQPSQLLSPGDTIALIPPVSGG